MLYVAFTEFMQVRLPAWIMFEIFGNVFGEQNVTGVSAIHYALGDVYSCAGDISVLTEVGDCINRSAVDSHSDPKFGMLFQLPGNLERTQHRRFRSRSKY